jgi:hypothetical protein
MSLPARQEAIVRLVEDVTVREHTRSNAISSSRPSRASLEAKLPGLFL